MLNLISQWTFVMKLSQDMLIVVELSFITMSALFSFSAYALGNSVGAA